MLDAVRIRSVDVEQVVTGWTDCIDLSRGYALYGDDKGEEDERQYQKALDAACLRSNSVREWPHI